MKHNMKIPATAAAALCILLAPSCDNSLYKTENLYPDEYKNIVSFQAEATSTDIMRIYDVNIDITQTVGRRESYKARIYLPKDMVFWGGFHPDYHIRYDYSQDPKTLKQHNNYKRWKAARNKAMQPEDTSVKHERLPRKTKKRLQKQQQPLINKKKAKRLSQIINALYLHAQGR